MPKLHAPHHIELIARGIIFNADRILICWSIPGDYGYLPGGHVEPGESAVAALERELIEEANQPIKVGPLLAIHENAFLTKHARHHELMLMYLAKLPTRLRSARTLESAEADLAFRWMTRATFRTADIRPEPAKAWLLKNWTGLSKGVWAKGRVDALCTLT